MGRAEGMSIGRACPHGGAPDRRTLKLASGVPHSEADRSVCLPCTARGRVPPHVCTRVGVPQTPSPTPSQSHDSRVLVGSSLGLCPTEKFHGHWPAGPNLPSYKELPGTSPTHTSTEPASKELVLFFFL